MMEMGPQLEPGSDATHDQRFRELRARRDASRPGSDQEIDPDLEAHFSDPGFDDHPPPNENGRTNGATAPGASSTRPWPSLAEIIRGMGKNVVRMPTGFATLDKATRGGLRVGTAVVIQAPPGLGKTGLGMHLAKVFVDAGAYVGAVAADEEDEGLACRYAQHLGFSRDDIEDPNNAAARELAASQVAGLPIVVVDSDKWESKVEDVSAYVAEHRGERPSVVLVDSIQLAPVDGGEQADGERARLELAMRVIKAERKKRNHLFVIISEVHRGLYRSNNPADRGVALAGSKGSSAIEYGAHLLLSLSAVPDEEDLVDVDMPKNRQGPKLPFRLRLDRRRCSFSEVPREAEEDGATDDVRYAKMVKRIADACKKRGDLSTVTKIALAAGGTKKFALQVANAMVEAGDLVLVGTGYRPKGGAS